MKAKLIFFTLVLGFCSTGIFAKIYKYDPATTEECRVRDGLPELFSKIDAKKEVRIAYFGGSITAADGWRVKSLSWLRKQFPETKFTEINATISGTGSGFGACRISTDILPLKPDLVFIEFRVNGGDGVEKQSIEGIVRQIKAADRGTDICFVYTLNESMRENIRDGKNTSFGQVMEEVANHYGIPSIDLGIEIMKREQDGTLLFKGDKSENGILLFSQDGTHPTNAGHDIYTDVLVRSLMKMRSASLTGRESVMPPQLFEKPYEKGALIPVESVSKSTGWQLVDIKRDTIYTKDRGRTNGMLRGAYKCSKAGESMTVSFEGTMFGMNDLTQGNPVIIEIVIDDKIAITKTRPQDSPLNLYSRNFLFPLPSDGKHTATLTVKSIPEGESYYVGEFLQAGPLGK
jgi:lysophospholipase L1-like esterase